jgi:hypothetical protein
MLGLSSYFNSQLNKQIMKYSHVALLTMVAAVFQFSCEESQEPNMAQIMEQKVLDKIEKNEGISYGLFQLLTDSLDAETITSFDAASGTQGEFVTLMTGESENYFAKVVEMNLSDFQIETIPTPYKSAEPSLLQIVSQEEQNELPYWPWELDYSSLIVKEIETQAAAGRKEWIIINSFDDGTSEPRQLAQETISLNYEKIKVMAAELHKVFMNMSLTDEQVLVTINEIMISHKIPPTAVALLVPAVQKVRDAATANSEPFGDALKVYLDETVGQAINGGLNRDIIRRIHALAFLAGLHTIILPEYDNANQDIASLSIMHARYRATIAGASGGIWKTSN